MIIIYKKYIFVNKQYISPLNASSEPIIHYDAKKDKKYTLIMYDPDAYVGCRIHWTIINIPGSDTNKGDIIFNYDGPHPPENTGIHKYIFLIFEQDSNIIVNINNNNKNRIITLENLLEKLNIKSEPIYRTYFNSSFINNN